MDILSPLAKDLARERLRHLVEIPQGETLPTRVSGQVATHQVVIRATRRRYSLPWCGTFRGALVPLSGGTLITGKFDSNWSLYFVGYPVLIGVIINIVVTIVSGHGRGNVLAFATFIAIAAALCGVLHWRGATDRRLITASICTATSGHVEREFD